VRRSRRGGLHQFLCGFKLVRIDRCGWLQSSVKAAGSAFGPSFGNYSMALQATKDGVRVAMGLRPYVEDDIAAGRLVMPFFAGRSEGPRLVSIARSALAMAACSPFAIGYSGALFSIESETIALASKPATPDIRARGASLKSASRRSLDENYPEDNGQKHNDRRIESKAKAKCACGCPFGVATPKHYASDDE